MTFEYVSVEEAIARDGLRMVVVGGVPSPWGEAAKGVLHVKRIDWVAVRLAYDSDTLKQWIGGQRSGPVAMHRSEAPRSGWAEILALAERLAPSPALLPDHPQARDEVLALASDICGEGGLGWSRRLQLIHVGLQNEGGFPARVAAYLGKKYGYSSEAGAVANLRVVTLLNQMAVRLRTQKAFGKPYYFGDVLTAVDIYSATFMAMFAPLPAAHCEMDPSTRAAFETRDAQTDAALDASLLEHRDMMYTRHLELPLRL